MSLSAVQNNQAWDKFATLAQAARVRNAGFNVPLSKTSVTASETKTIRRTEVPRGINSAHKYYKPAVAEKPKTIVGTRFDAYA